MNKTTVSKAELARRHGVTRAAVGSWIKGGLPMTSDGRINTRSADAWLTRYRTHERQHPKSESLAEARLRKTISLANLAEWRLEKKRAGLIDVAVADRAWQQVRRAILKAVLSIEDKAVPRCTTVSDPLEVRNALRDIIHGTLRSLPDQIRSAVK